MRRSSPLEGTRHTPLPVRCALCVYGVSHREGWVYIDTPPCENSHDVCMVYRTGRGGGEGGVYIGELVCMGHIVSI